MSDLAHPASCDAVVLEPSERRRIAFLLGLALTAGTLVLAGFAHRWIGDVSQAPVADVIEGIAALLVAVPLLVNAARGLCWPTSGAILDQLVAIAVLASLVSGQFVTAVFVPMIVSLGHFLEQRSVLGAQAAIESLKTLHARRALRLDDAGGETEVLPDQLRPGDVVRVRPGEIVPADGVVVRGCTTLDQSSISGESAPVEAAVGSTLFAGSVNLVGVVEVEVTRVGDETALGRVRELLREAEQSKTPVVRLLESYSGYYVPMMLLVAFVVLFTTRDLSRAIAVLVVSCPGAFVLSGPAAMIAALAAASRLGILVKNAKFLEALADVDTVVFDKTGTLTLGRLEVVEVRPHGACTGDDLLAAAAICAAGSRHPVARAILAIAPSLPARDGQASETFGRGVEVHSGGHVHRLGRRDWLRSFGLDVPDDPPPAGALAWVARGDRVLGVVLLADRPRPEARAALEELRELGLRRTVLLTGDRRVVASQVADSLGIEHVVAEVLPEQKLAAVAAEKQAGRSVLVVGDGVNDALALARGDVGVAMGAMGSDVALRSADVALMSNDLRRLPLAIHLSRRTRTTIHQNLLVGAGSSIVMLALASFGIISPLAGAILHNVGEFYVVGNSARLLRFAMEDEAESGAVNA